MADTPTTSPASPPLFKGATVTPATVAPTLSAAYSALARLTAAIGQRWVDLMAQAAYTAGSCVDKARRAADALLGQANAIYAQTGIDVELASYNVLGAAYEIALAQGCVPITPADLQPPPNQAPAPFGPLPGQYTSGGAPAKVNPQVCVPDLASGECVQPPELPRLILPGLTPPEGPFTLPGVTGPPVGGAPGGPTEPAPPGGAFPGLQPGPVQPPLLLPDFGFVPLPAPGAGLPVFPPGGLPLPPGGVVPGPFPPQPIGRPVPLPPLTDPVRPPFVMPNPGDYPPVMRQPPPGGAVPPTPAPGRPPGITTPPAGPGVGVCPPNYTIDLDQLKDYLCPPTTPPAPPPTAPPGEKGPPEEPPGEAEPKEEEPPIVAPPAPPEEPGGGLERTPLSQINLDSPEGCAMVAQWVASGADAMQQWLDEWSKPLDASPAPADVSKYGVIGAGIINASEGVQEFIGYLIRKAQNLVSEMRPRITGCTAEGTLPLAASLALVDFVEKWLGLGLDGTKKAMNQILDTMCPVLVPSEAQAAQAYLADEITYEQFLCWARANNKMPNGAIASMRAGRMQPNQADLVSLYLREYLSLDALYARMRGIGSLDRSNVSEYLELAKFIPPPTDLTSFLVRDVFDENVVKTYGYAEEFEEKFTGKAEKWAAAQGMTAEQFRYYWYAHWRLPSPTQGYEFVHRLRPGRVPDDVVTTQEDLIKLLQVNDYPSYWGKRLAAVSHPPLRLVDLRNAYFRGVVDDKELYEQLLDRGYDKRNADIVRRYFRRAKVEYWLARPVGKAYLAGTVHTAQLIRLLKSEGLEGDMLDSVVTELQNRRDDLTRQSCLKLIRQRFLSHELEDWEAQAELQSAGFGPENAVELVRAWGCQRPKKSKTIAAAQLCTWVELGLVSIEDATVRLVKMGFSRQDATNIMDQCSIRVREGQAKKLERAQKAALAASERDRKRREKEAREAASAARTAASELRKAKREAEKREARINKLAATAAKSSKRAPEEEAVAIDAAMVDLATRENVSREAALDLIEQAIAWSTVSEGQTWTAALAAIARGMPPVG